MIVLLSRLGNGLDRYPPVTGVVFFPIDCITRLISFFTMILLFYFFVSCCLYCHITDTQPHYKTRVHGEKTNNIKRQVFLLAFVEDVRHMFFYCKDLNSPVVQIVCKNPLNFVCALSVTIIYVSLLFWTAFEIVSFV